LLLSPATTVAIFRAILPSQRITIGRLASNPGGFSFLGHRESRGLALARRGNLSAWLGRQPSEAVLDIYQRTLANLDRPKLAGAQALVGCASAHARDVAPAVKRGVPGKIF
jgi:hypothetical protein